MRKLMAIGCAVVVAAGAILPVRGTVICSGDSFAVFMEGNLKVDESGNYSFAAFADDRLVIYIDGKSVANAVWTSVATGNCWLKAGLHRIAMAVEEVAVSSKPPYHAVTRMQRILRVLASRD